MKKNPEAFLFDLNGTMIDDMKYHLEVWFEVITKDLGASLTREELRSQMYGKNEEVLIRIFGESRFKQFNFEAISQAKEERYQEIYKPHLQLLSGLPDFLQSTKEKKIKMAIGSAAPPFNVDFVLDNLEIRDYFQVVVSGVEAAANAGIECVVVTTMHDANEFTTYNNVRLFIKDFRDPRLSTHLFIES